MANPLSRISFSRQVLPLLAIIGLVVAAAWIWMDLPDRSTIEPEEQPPRASGELADAARVAGSGVVEPSSELIDVGSALSGLVTDLKVKPGDRVEKGQPLFSIDTRSIRAQLDETQARVNEAQASVREADAAIAAANAAISEARAAEQTANQQLALFRNIDDPAAISQSELIQAEGNARSASERRRVAESQLAQAQSRRGQAEAQVRTAQAAASRSQTEIGRSVVRAPVRGEILAVNIRPGEFVATQGGGNAQPFIQMGETDPLHVRIDVDEGEAVRLSEGEPAIVSPRGDAETRVRARFVRVEPQVVPKRSLTNSASERVDVRVVQIIFALPASDAFRVGQQVDAFMPAKEQSE
jgi:multidrug resistance efflux pump